MQVAATCPGSLSLDVVPCGVLLLATDGTIQAANRRAGALLGYAAAELAGVASSVLLPERLRADAGARRALLDVSEAAIGQGRSLALRRKDGTELAVEVTVQALPGEPQQYSVAYLTDLTFRRQRELERMKVLIGASRAFSDKIESPPELAQTIARTCVEMVGDFGAIRLIRKGGEWLDLAALYQARPELEKPFYEYLRNAAPIRVGDGLAGRVAARNEALLLCDLQLSTLAAQAVPQHREFLERMAVQALLIVPIRARGEVLGCVTVARVEVQSPFDEDDRELLQLLADSAGVAVYNSRIFADLVRAEAAVRQLQLRNAQQAEIHATMLRNMPRAAVFLIDHELRFLSAEGACVAQLLGRSTDEVAGKTVHEVVPERHGSELLSAVTDTLAGKTVSFRGSTGERIYEIRGAPIFYGSASGSPRAALIQLYDITELVQQEQELSHSQERFRALVEHVPVGVFDFDSAGTARFLNDKFVQLLGLPAEEIATAEQRARWVQPDDLAALREALARARLEGQPFRIVLRYQPPDKPLRRLLMQCMPLRSSAGALRSLVGILEDVTAELDAAEQTRRSLREKEVLLAEIHHRVKNNLQVVTSIVNLQANRIEDEKLRAVFDDVRSRIQAIAFLHERIYGSPDLSRIEIAEYFQGLLTSAARVVGADPSCARVRTPDEPLHLQIERAVPLGLLVNELVTNAFKYGRRGDAAPAVEVVVEHHQDRARVTVSDQGPGFPEGFTPDSTRTLGLYLVKQLARQLDGTIRYEQQPTRCVLEFPWPEG